MDVKKKISRFIDTKDVSRIGAIAQLVEHLHGMQGSAVRVRLAPYKITNLLMQ